MQKSSKRNFCFVFTTLFLCFNCSHQTPVQPPIEKIPTAQEQRVIEASNVFGFNLFKEVCRFDTAGGNVFVSPLSVSMALGMTMNGASGSTREAMRIALGCSGLTDGEINASYRSIKDMLPSLDPKVEFQIANSIWIRQGFPVKAAFVECNRTFFDAVARALDFGADFAADTMNAWVAVNTNGRIKEIVAKPIPKDAVMYLINTCYFKGAWARAFDTKNTVQAPFHLFDNTTKPCYLMQATDSYGYFETNEFQAIELTCGKGRFGMVVLLPAVGKTVDDIAGDVTPEHWSGWMTRLKADSVALSMPKFTFAFEQELKEALSALGMGIAFDPFGADFTNIHGDGELFISKVKHKTFVEVNEEGAEAAAATSVEISKFTMPGETKIMRIDRPFIFAVRESVTGAVLFIGKALDPESN